MTAKSISFDFRHGEMASSSTPPLAGAAGDSTAATTDPSESQDIQKKQARNPPTTKNDGEAEHNADDDEPPTCRICLEEGWVPGRDPPPSPTSDGEVLGRLISPCLCNGSIRYVHARCLNMWRRSGSGSSDSYRRCSQCKYEYGVRRTHLSSFLMGDSAPPALAISSILVAVHALGGAGLATTTPGARLGLYRWLRLDLRGVGGVVGAPWLTGTAYGELLTVGGAALGLAFFAIATVRRVREKYLQYRAGRIGPEAFFRDAVFVLLWVRNETAQNGTGRGLAAVGLIMACVQSYDEAMSGAKYVAQRLGETILEPTSADRRRLRVGRGR